MRLLPRSSCDMEPRTGAKLLRICLAALANSAESAGTTLWTQTWSKRSGLKRRTSWYCSVLKSRAQSGVSSPKTYQAAPTIKSKIDTTQTCRRSWMTSPNLALHKSTTAWMSHNRNQSLALSTHKKLTVKWSTISAFQSKLWVLLIAQISFKNRLMRSHRLLMTPARHAALLSWCWKKMSKPNES